MLPELQIAADVSYRESGGRDAPALVLLHGWGLNVRVWDTLGAALEGRFRLIAVDLPGHGRSPWRAEYAPLRSQAHWIARAVAAVIGTEPP